MNLRATVENSAISILALAMIAGFGVFLYGQFVKHEPQVMRLEDEANAYWDGKLGMIAAKIDDVQVTVERNSTSIGELFHSVERLDKSVSNLSKGALRFERGQQKIANELKIELEPEVIENGEREQ